MKLSISLPNSMAHEIRHIASETEKNVSWWIQQAWSLARTRLLQSKTDVEFKKRKALKKFSQLQGILKDEYPHVSSVELTHQAFQKK